MLNFKNDLFCKKEMGKKIREWGGRIGGDIIIKY